MTFDVLIHGGEVYDPEPLGRADIGIRDGRVAAVGDLAGASARTAIAAEGLLVLPGLVETHAHMLLPFAGTVTQNDFYDGTVAGAFGGVTTLIDFAAQLPGQPLSEAIGQRVAQAQGDAVVDYGFHLILTEIRPEVLQEMEEVVRDGISSFKFFTTYRKDQLYVGDGDLRQAFARVAELGGLATVHAENDDIVEQAIGALVRAGRTSPKHYPLSKPEISEVEAISRAILLAEEAGTDLLIRHVSSARGAREIRRARGAGQRVFGETCPQYLALTDEVYGRADARNFLVHPPIRTEKDRAGLWEGIEDGSLLVIGTDDCAFTREQKLCSDVFTEIPGGMPGIETRLAVMYTEGVLNRGLSLEALARITSTNPARLYGLYPRKGALRPGSDADMVLFDPEPAGTIRAGALHGKADWTPFEGWPVRGVVRKTVSRGAVIVDGDACQVPRGRGEYLERGAPGTP